MKRLIPAAIMIGCGVLALALTYLFSALPTFSIGQSNLEFVACGELKVEVTKIGREDSGLTEGEVIRPSRIPPLEAELLSRKVDVVRDPTTGELAAVPSTNNFCRDLE